MAQSRGAGWGGLGATTRNKKEKSIGIASLIGS
jgi:hypothetical protein